MEKFNFYQPTRTHFGAGRFEEVGEVVARYGSTCLLVTAPNNEEVLRPLYDRAKALLAAAGVKVVHFDEVVPNPTIGGIEKAIGLVRSEGVQVVLGLGGGSSLDTAKSVALFHGVNNIPWDDVFSNYTDPFARYALPGPAPLPVVAVPTTSGTGSELTHAMVVSDPSADRKECIFHHAVFPAEAVIDPLLTLTLPPYPTAVTGFDAFSHAFESFLREHASPYTKMLGLKAMSLIISALPKLMNNPGDEGLREAMSLAEMFAGISLSNAAATMPHPLSEIVGGIQPAVAHGQCLATLYPAFLRYIAPLQPARCAEVARLFNPQLAAAGDEEAAAALPALMEAFLASVGLNKPFSACGVTRAQMEQATGHFLLGVLPFAPKEVMVQILWDSF